jgi:hemerythrin superfamily protein
MNVIELLKKDHRNVSELFAAYETAKDDGEEGSRQEIAREICLELTAHAKVEEELFYPAVDAKSSGDEDTQEKVKEADEEHRLVKALVGEIQDMDEDDDNFDAKVKVLKDVVDHHVEEEEGELMPKAKKLLTPAELEEMGTEAEARKEKLKAKTGKETARGKSSTSDRNAPRLAVAGSRKGSASRDARPRR